MDPYGRIPGFLDRSDLLTKLKIFKVKFELHEGDGPLKLGGYRPKLVISHHSENAQFNNHYFRHKEDDKIRVKKSSLCYVREE
jgi:phospholipase C